MPDNRLTLTIEAQNLAQAAFKQFQTDVRQSNEALQKTGQAGRQSSTGIKVYRDELGRFHDAVTGRYVSAARLLKEGFTEVERGADDSTEAIKRANPAIARMRREFDFLRNDIHNAAGVFRQFSTAIQSQIRVQVNAAANLERLRVGLDTISGSSAAAEQQYRRLVEVSRYPGINIENSLRASLQLQALRKSGEEAVEVVREFGNALALSGTAPRELNQVVNAIKQLSGEGKILQEDIAIITTRVARLVPELQDAFGGSRAKDVREFFDALGVDESDQADQFLRIVLDRLAKLPRAGDTAANAIENLNDTTDRLQASIGANFLPIVREATGRLEKFLQEIERDPQATRNIAILEALGGTFLTVTAAGLGFAAALPAVAAGLAFLATNPIGLTIVAVAALTAGLVALKVASQDVETQVERLATTFDELDTALRKNHEAIQSNQQAQVESAKSSLTAQRTAIEQHITLLEEERASIERSIEANRKRAEQGLLPIASTGESFATQLDNANARLEVTQHRLQEVNDALRANEEASVPIQKATVNIETLTKAVTRLKAELEEETTFEGISQSVTGDPAGFRSSAQALADIETLLRVNVDRFKELREAAASGNQEAATALSKLNQQFEGLRDTQADRHVDNLAAAFEKLTKTTDPSRKQLEAILKSADAFVQIFQGGADVLQDDVSRALGLISQVREQLQGLTADELRLEAHDEGAQALTEALLRFYDLQSTVQEDAGVDAQRSAEKQATAYIRAYQDSIDPAVLNVVDSVKTLREEVRGAIQDLERVQAQDALKLDVRGETGAEQRDALAELFDLNQAVQDGIRENEISNLRKRSLALREKLADDTLSLQQYQADAAAILRALYEADRSFQSVDVREDLNKRQAENARKLSQTILALEDATKDGQIERILKTAQERQRALAGNEGALKVIYDRFVQLEQDTQDKRAAVILGSKVADARKELIGLEERALDASSSRQLEALTRDTREFVDMYSERGEAFRDLVADAQDLGGELQQAFDLTEQTRRLEDFRDGVADVITDLASIAVDHIFDSFTDSTRYATDAVTEFRDGIRLLESDILRLERGGEDADIRRQRILEDRDRRLEQLRRQQQTLAARSPSGDQRALERNVQRQQDISARISSVREDFAVRLSRFDEDTSLRQQRLIEDATQRRERSQSEQTSLVGDIGQTLETAMKNALADRLSGYLTKTAFDTGVSLITAGLGALGIGDVLKGFLGGGSEGDGDGTETPTTPQTPAAGDGDTSSTTPPSLEGDADVDGTIKTLTVDPMITTPTVDVAGLIKSAMQAVDGYTTPSVDTAGLIKSAKQATDGYTIPSIDAKGRITSAELSEGASLPSVPGLKGGIERVVLQRSASLPLVPGLTGEIDSLSIKETLEDLPSAPPLQGRIDALTIATEATAGLSVNIAGIINALTLEGTLPSPSVGITGLITNLALAEDEDAPNPPSVNVAGIVNSLAVAATVPTLEGLTVAIKDVTLNPDIDPPTVSGLAGRIDSIALDPDIDLPTIKIAATAVVGAVTGGQGGGDREERAGEEDPENPRLDGEGLEGTISRLSIDPATLADIQPVMLSGVIKPVLDLSAIPDPIVLRGRIDAFVNYLTGAGGGGGAVKAIKAVGVAAEMKILCNAPRSHRIWERLRLCFKMRLCQETLTQVWDQHPVLTSQKQILILLTNRSRVPRIPKGLQIH